MYKEDALTVMQNDLTTLDKTFRTIVLRLLNHLQLGHLKMFEQGQLIAEFGDKASELKAEIDIQKGDFYRRFLFGGSIGAAELFMDESWTTPNLTQVIQLFARNLPALDAAEAKFSWLLLPLQKFQHWRRNNSKRQAKENISAHYDLGNDLYQAFLDPALQYSSAVYPHADASLAEAQQHKLKRLCDSLELCAEDHLLEIGTGWGGMAVFAAKHYGCKVTTTTISEEQYSYTKELIEREGLTQQITLLKKDYRDLEGTYDKLVSVEMIEAVGLKYMPTFFKTCSRLLKPNGKMALQAITIADQRMKSYANSVDFIQKYIFPGGFLPSLTMMAEMFTKHTDMVMREVRDIGYDYAKTLADWRDNFNQAHPQLIDKGYDERFGRMWNYYLCYCEGGFWERTVSAVQLVATKPQSR
ncbi:MULTISPECIES: SAM-dependent methyltransferase [Idiomarina]|uniref:SAM-dependent methyltransferase n=1 Tax=Idiomarina TaxID=135575 RepID=UPI00129A669F|nr:MULTISPECIES: cyclopropane-fatty-acyl-phospholipid synthase family protein [Idiomarina]MRJ40698.1 methyltransferase domain-containing protein [Idiomarina sp. FeN1]NCU56502.1 methyltransferase domain-containing protein [Idiomarina sp. FenA--70]NCU58882.1 methyltransferase domain-containing protein [Idiomarina sp. FenBw--71]UUN14613.1 class I SAM-dependent methyltransferase [Idiomarina loihiensis]